MSMGGAIVQLTFVSCVGEMLCVSDVTETHSHSKFPGHLTLTIFPFLFPQCSLSLRYGGCFENAFFGIGLHDSAFWLVVVFYSGLLPSQRDASLLRDED